MNVVGHAARISTLILLMISTTCCFATLLLLYTDHNFSQTRCVVVSTNASATCGTDKPFAYHVLYDAYGVIVASTVCSGNPRRLERSVFPCFVDRNSVSRVAEHRDPHTALLVLFICGGVSMTCVCCALVVACLACCKDARED
jgi:hypothetical protein